MKTLILKTAAIIALSTSTLFSQSSYGTIKGLIKNNAGEPMYGATVKITQGGVLVGGAQTDENGKYTYKPLNPGFYEVVVFGMDFSTQSVTNVGVKPEKTAYVDMIVSLNEITGFTVTAEYKAPIVDNSYVSMKSIDAEDLMHTAVDRTNLTGAILNMTSDATEDAEGGLHVRGGRAESSALFVDGVRTPNLTGISMIGVENISYISGGVPAQYGDAVSGVIVVTTKDYFSGIRSKRIRETAFNDKLQAKQREKQAQQEVEKRKKEIEEELIKEGVQN